jgi:hypothetical protein
MQDVAVTGGDGFVSAKVRTIVSSFLRGKGRAPITPSNACLDR